MIKEIIVVEGKDDILAVKAAVDGEVVATGGYAYGKKLFDLLKTAENQRGIIIFTDPDWMGEKIRRDLGKKFPSAKHAFLPRRLAMDKEDIGIENASPEDIRRALSRAKATEQPREDVFTMKDLREKGLIGGPDAQRRREDLGELLGIGKPNGKGFLRRLNGFSISREAFEKGCEQLDY